MDVEEKQDAGGKRRDGTTSVLRARELHEGVGNLCRFQRLADEERIVRVVLNEHYGPRQLHRD
jgi:hypothetical protein